MKEHSSPDETTVQGRQLGFGNAMVDCASAPWPAGWQCPVHYQDCLLLLQTHKVLGSRIWANCTIGVSQLTTFAWHERGHDFVHDASQHVATGQMRSHDKAGLGQQAHDAATNDV